MDKLHYCSSHSSVRFILLDLLFQSYLWRLRLYLSSHITPKIVLNITKTFKIYWYISTFFEVLMICLIFQFLRASYALSTRYCEQKQKACSAVIFHILQFFFRFHFAFTKSRSTALLFSFVLVLWPTGMDVNIFFSVASLEFTSTVFLLHGSRDSGDCSSG